MNHATRGRMCLIVPSLRAAELLATTAFARAGADPHANAEHNAGQPDLSPREREVTTLKALTHELFALYEPSLAVATAAQVLAATLAVCVQDASTAIVSPSILLERARAHIRDRNLLADAAVESAALVGLSINRARAPLSRFAALRVNDYLRLHERVDARLLVEKCVHPASVVARVTSHCANLAAPAPAFLVEMGGFRCFGLLGLSESEIRLLVALRAEIWLPLFSRPFDTERERDALEVLADDFARRADEAPSTWEIMPVLGDLAGSLAPYASASLTVYAAPRAGEQARYIAESVAAALDEGTALAELAVALVQDDEEALRALLEALEIAGVPATDVRGTRIATSMTVCMARLILKALLSPFDRDRAARCLASPLFDLRQLAEGATARKCMWLARKCGISPPFRDASFSAGLARVFAHSGPKVAALGALIVAVFARIERQLKAATSRSESILVVRETLNILGLAAGASRGAFHEFAADEPVRGATRLAVHALSESSRAAQALAQALLDVQTEEAASGVGDAAGTPLDLFDTAVALLPEFQPLPPASCAGVLHVGLAESLSLGAFAHVWLVGVARGALAESGPELTSLSREVSEALEAAQGRPLFAPAAETKLAHLALIVRSAKRVDLTYVHHAEDAMMQPASFIAALGANNAVLAKVVPANAAAADVERRTAWEYERERYFLDPKRRGSEVVGETSHLAWLSLHSGTKEAPLALTSLERFVGCAYRGFAERVLRASSVDEDSELLDPRSEGTLQHKVLEAAFVATSALWAARPRAAGAITDIAREAAHSVVRRDEYRTLAQPDIDALLVRVERIVQQSIADETWDFALAEQSFGAPDDRWIVHAIEKPVNASQAGGSDSHPAVWVRGRLDRLDRLADGSGLRVVDYKRKAPTLKALGVSALQLPIYADVAETELKLPVLDGRFATLDEGIKERKRGADKAEQQFQESRDIARVTAVSAMSLVRAGKIWPNPQDPKGCVYCAVKGLCRRPPFAVPAAETEEASAEEASSAN